MRRSQVSRSSKATWAALLALKALAVLATLAAGSILASCAVGIVVASTTTWWLLVFIAFGAFIVVAYNLELFGGSFHSDLWFGVAWGAFPAHAFPFSAPTALGGV